MDTDQLEQELVLLQTRRQEAILNAPLGVDVRGIIKRFDDERDRIMQEFRQDTDQIIEISIPDDIVVGEFIQKTIMDYEGSIILEGQNHLFHIGQKVKVVPNFDSRTFPNPIWLWVTGVSEDLERRRTTLELFSRKLSPDWE